MPKHAVVLAAGMGTRLQPYTLVLPKPLMRIGDYPILEVLVRQLANHGFSRITLAVNHQANLIKAFFADGKRWDVQIDYSLETIPFSTVAPLRLMPDLPDNFLLMNGDVLTDVDFSALYDLPRKRWADIHHLGCTAEPNHRLRGPANRRGVAS